MQNGSKQNGKKPNEHGIVGMVETQDSANSDVERLPCELCLIKVSPIKVDGWLAQLEKMAQSGDYENLIEQLAKLRTQLYVPAAIQQAANLGGVNAKLRDPTTEEVG